MVFGKSDFGWQSTSILVVALTCEDSSSRAKSTVSTYVVNLRCIWYQTQKTQMQFILPCSKVFVHESFSSSYIFSHFPIIRLVAAITLLIMLLYTIRSAYNKFKEKQLSRHSPIPTISMTIKEPKSRDIPLIQSTSFANVNKVQCKTSDTEELQNQDPSTSHQSE